MDPTFKSEISVCLGKKKKMQINEGDFIFKNSNENVLGLS